MGELKRVECRKENRGGRKCGLLMSGDMGSWQGQKFVAVLKAKNRGAATSQNVKNRGIVAAKIVKNRGDIAAKIVKIVALSRPIS